MSFDNTAYGRQLDGQDHAKRGIPVEQKQDEAWHHFRDRENAAANFQKTNS